MIWPFRRKQAPTPAQPVAPAAPRDMRNDTEGWKVGDLARCINDEWHSPSPGDPVFGEIRRVSAVHEGPVKGCHAIAIGLRFVGHGQRCWICDSFEKIRPEIVGADEAFTVSLRDLLRKTEKA